MGIGWMGWVGTDLRRGRGLTQALCNGRPLLARLGAVWAMRSVRDGACGVHVPSTDRRDAM